MNLVGKLFVVIIMVMSVMFMSLAMAVYSTHRNWRADFEAKQGELSAEQNLNSQLREEKQDLETTLAMEKLYYGQQLAKLRTENTALSNEQARLDAELTRLVNEKTTLESTVSAVQGNMSALLTEVNSLRNDINDAHQQRDVALAGLVASTEQLHTRLGELERAEEQLSQLTRQVSQYTSLLDQNGIDPMTSADGIVPRVAGEVTGILQGKIELSIGRDDGIREGQTVEVYRADRYLGRAKIVVAEPDKAVAEMDRSIQRGAVQKGDYVATRLN